MIDADPAAPATVIATTPADDATGVDPAIAIEATFSRDMDASTIDGTTFQVAAGGASVAGSVAYDAGTRVATFRPDPRLALLGGYTATITTGVTDAEGGALAAPATWTFEVRDGAWATATLLDGPAVTFAPIPEVAFAGDGTAFVAWHADGVQVARHVPGSGWEATTELAASSASWPAVAADAAGNAIVIWAGGLPHDLLARHFTPGSGWGPIVTLDVDDAYAHHVGLLHDVAFDADGHAIVVWHQQDEVWARRYVAGDGWGPLVSVGAGVNPRLAIGPGGTAFAAWMSPSSDITVARFAPGAGWSAPAVIGSGSRVRLGVDGEGNAIAVWAWEDGERWNAMTSRYTSGTGWTPIMPLENSETFALHPEIAVHRDGTAIAVWQQGPDVIARDFAPGSGWADPIGIGHAAGAQHPMVAIDPAGNAVAVFTEEDDGSTTSASRRVAGGAWSEPVRIDATDAGDSFFTTVAVDAIGRAAAVWTRSIGPSQSGSEYRVWANVFE